LYSCTCSAYGIKRGVDAKRKECEVALCIGESFEVYNNLQTYSLNRNALEKINFACFLDGTPE
jgi:hypothetical protein